MRKKQWRGACCSSSKRAASERASSLARARALTLWQRDRTVAPHGRLSHLTLVNGFRITRVRRWILFCGLCPRALTWICKAVKQDLRAGAERRRARGHMSLAGGSTLYCHRTSRAPHPEASVQSQVHAQCTALAHQRPKDPTPSRGKRSAHALVSNSANMGGRRPVLL